MNTRIYLDTRATKSGEESPLKYVVAKDGKSAYISLDIKVKKEDWNNEACKVLPSNKSYRNINATILRKKAQYDDAKDRMATRSMSARQIRDAILNYIDPTSSTSFLDSMDKFAKSRKSLRTQELYGRTLNKVRAYVCEKTHSESPSLSFQDIDKEWLVDFEKWLETSSHKGCTMDNSKGIHLRNIRAVFNDAIDNELTTNYPFRKFKIKKGDAKHRALSVGMLREILTTEVQPYQVMYRDMFKLSFLLIGINGADLFKKKEKDVIVADRYEYNRAKTGKFLSVKIEPEAREILERYKGNDGMLLNVMDGYGERNKDFENFYIKIDKALKRIGKWELHPKSHKMAFKEAICNKLSWYWARHSWATIAAELDIPKETIHNALGHSTGDITDTYIVFNRSKVDEANRKVIDYVLYDKK